MPTTIQMLTDYPDQLLEALIEQRSASTSLEGSHAQVIESLAGDLTEPISVQYIYQELVEEYAQAGEAVDALLKAGGEMSESDFSRMFGGIRQMGPAKLARECPWLTPESIAEVLYYNALIGRGFRGAGQSAQSIVYLPSDITPWLPRSQPEDSQDTLAIPIAAPPPRARTIAADDSLLEDLGTLLGFVRGDSLRLSGAGPNAEDIDRFVKRLQLPFDDSMPEQNTRLAFLLHIANRLGWLRRGEGGAVTLTGNQVSAFLEKTRAEQRQAIFDAWCNSPDWNDLRRTPGMECSDGDWKNDPLQTRSALLSHLGRLPPNGWFHTSSIVDAIKLIAPEFQRPTGRYDDWTIRDSTTQESLAGFDHWDDVEGGLIRFVLRGPLHWLGAVDLAEPAAGDDWLISLTNWGARWLGMDVAQPHEIPHRAIQVRDDFSLVLPVGAPLQDRFRVERFAQWQASYPQYVYQVNQRSLRRSADEGISGQQILEFLSSRSQHLPDNVMAALRRFAQETRGQSGSLPAAPHSHREG